MITLFWYFHAKMLRAKKFHSGMENLEWRTGKRESTKMHQ